VSYVEIPWTAEVAATVRTEWGLPGGTAERLTGGEESAAYRVGGVVVRLGPVGRGTEVMEWCHQLAQQAGVREAVAPLAATSGATVVRVNGRPVSVWPLVPGRWLDLDSAQEVEQAARLLARLHRALRGVQLPARPELSFLEPTASSLLQDDQLDRWLAEFAQRAARQPLHGDYYRGNLLYHRGKITGLIDWDEAWLGAPEIELAGAAREFGDHWSTDLTRAKQFIDWYQDEGGTAEPMDDETLVQLIRHRLRAEVTAFGGKDSDDEYYNLQRELFAKLRP
jgi:Ser/Thr protein kinase RdoA (MazF antagonist)